MDGKKAANIAATLVTQPPYHAIAATQSTSLGMKGKGWQTTHEKWTWYVSYTLTIT
jgi:hypothetical protein